ncbi:hypothetical protein M0805_000723 [Coniferiporia weirii]|nr:hypothetical protein M0805_000723 [Coniferiporia weirii]
MTLTSLNVPYVALGLITTLLIASLVRSKNSKSALPLPPGPRPLPLIQNLLDLPKGFEAFHWAKHKGLYGPISSLSVPGTTIVILNDAQTAFSLLEKRSAIYSGRPSFRFGGDMVGFSGVTTLLQYGPILKTHRKEMHKCIGTPAAMERFVGLEEIETHRFLLRLLEEPSNLIKHIRNTAGAIILKISYGYTTTPRDSDPLVDLADASLSVFSDSIVPGKWVVDTFPFLRFIPDWVPGMGFKETAREWNKVTMDFINKPYAFVKHQMKTGNGISSFARGLIERNVSDEYVMKWIAASLYGGGADTTVSAVATFFLAMTLYPDVYKKAQAEVDTIVGRVSLPLLMDRGRLPYIEAIEKESLRWNNVVPMGAPHVSCQEDTYMGYRIPKGAIVLSNIWQMTHDPAVYHDPFTFKPERFLGENAEPDPRALAFGFGRRICPGKELADGSLFLSIAMTTAVFDVSCAKDATGRDIDPVYEYTPGLISHPTSFEYSVTPRDEAAELLIRSVLDKHPFEAGDADVLASLAA